VRNASFEKRLRERQKQEKRLAKIAKRHERNAQKRLDKARQGQAPPADVQPPDPGTTQAPPPTTESP
jgi:hypothetical protein